MGADVSAISAPKWRRRKLDRPQEILRAGLTVFATNGFAAARLEDVADKAGISKGTLYLYFASKEDLFRAIVRAQVEEQMLHAEGKWSAAVADEMGVRAGIELIVGDMAQVMATPRAARISKLVLAEAAAFPDIAAWYRDHVIMRVHAVLMRLVERGVERGVFIDAPRNEAVRSLLAPVFMLSATLSLAGFQQTFKINVEQQVAASLDIWFRGMLANTGHIVKGS